MKFIFGGIFMDKSLKIDLLKALCSDLQSKCDCCVDGSGPSQKEIIITEGIELIISGLESDSMEPINLTAKFFMDYAYDYEPLVKIIIKAETVDDVIDNKTLLMWAAKSGYFYVAKILILQDLDINQEILGYNALDYAYDNGHGIMSWLFFKLGSRLAGIRSEKTQSYLEEMPVPAGFASVLSALA